MKEIYSKIVDLLKDGRAAVLATIIKLRGSGPRGVGAKLLILDDGTTLGSVGGGLLEARVLEAAGKVLKKPLPVRLNLSMMGRDLARSEMLCGGDVDVFLEPILPEDPSQQSLYEKMADIYHRGASGLLATLVSAADLRQQTTAPKLLLEREAGCIGSIPGVLGFETVLREELNGLLRKRKSILVSYRSENGREVDLFVEPVTASPVVHIFGGGHVSAQIVPLAAHAGFDVVVVDDRAEFADPKRFPDALEVIQMDFEGAVAKLPVNKASYMVIVTRGHAHDKTVLEQCLKTEAGYIGMIGSRRKRDIVYEGLMKEGFTRADLDRVHSPIGIKIGAETPEEIGVSIVAELIKVRAGEEEKSA